MLSNLHKRFLLFLLVCIPLRALIVYLAATRHDLLVRHRLVVAALALMVGCGFMYIYASGVRPTGAFGRPAWWNSMRPVHGFLYLYCTYLVLRRDPNAYLPLLLDVTLGLTAFVLHHTGVLM